MNFLLLRSSQTAAPEHPPVTEIQSEPNYTAKANSTLEGLIAGAPFPESTFSDKREVDEDGNLADSSGKTSSQVLSSHIDVKDDEGWITIPNKILPDDWSEAPDISSIQSSDRCFLIPGEQVHVLACLSAYKQDTEIITPFKVAAVMNKNGIGQSNQKQNSHSASDTSSISHGVAGDDSQDVSENGHANIDPENEVAAGESLLRLEDYKRQTESLVQKFNNSHFFARISESDDPLWSKRKPSEESSEMIGADGLETEKTLKKKLPLNASIDRGTFDASTCGGVARNAVKCCALPNGDIVVHLQINVGVEFVRHPILEILQFEKHQERSLFSIDEESMTSAEQDPCGELLKWLLPLDNSISSSARPLTPPQINSGVSIRSVSTKPTLSGSSGSQLFSFGNFRSYSMSSLPPNSAPPPSVTTPSYGPSFNPEDWERFSFQRSVKSEKSGSQGLLSFRGVSLEPERFSVRCGLEGIFIPGRRWRRKIDIIQPVEINSFAADCNTDDLLCVQIKNVSPAHAPEILVYIDAITVVFEEASKSSPPLSLPIACIEAGNDHSLPNLTLRRGEEHSFILKPVTSILKSSKSHSEKNLRSSRPNAGSAAPKLHQSSNNEKRDVVSPTDRYAVLVSCRCNYTESKLFFKQPTSWRPRLSRDLMISVASEMTKQTLGSSERGTQLPVQVLTLQAANLTSQDLTMTVLAPASFTSPPSVVSLSSSPTSPMSPFLGSSEFTERVSIDKQITAAQSQTSVSQNQAEEGQGHSQSVSFGERAIPIADVLRSGDSGCTHLWLQSRVPLGCVPSQSTATIKLEVLPLTDGIITLDTLQIDVKEKGLAYVPEHSLKINATSSISTGVI